MTRPRIPRVNSGEESMLAWCRTLKLPAPMRNYRFHPTRRWEIDFAWPGELIGIEIQGGVWMKGGAHSLPSNILRDMIKHNALLDLGWRVWCFTPQEAILGTAAQKMQSLLKPRQGVQHAHAQNPA